MWNNGHAKCPGAACAATHGSSRIDESGWNDRFRVFFQEKQGKKLAGILRAIEILKLPENQRAQVTEKAKSLLKTDSGGAYGSIGEAVLAFLLEEKNLAVLTKFTLREAPFRVQKGGDLIGVDLHQMRALYAEIKTRSMAEYTPKAIADTKAELKKDIAVPRIKGIFEAVGRNESGVEVCALVRDRVEAGHLKLTKEQLDLLEGSKRKSFSRIGALVFSGTVDWGSIDEACPHDHSADFPLSLGKVEVGDLAAKILGLAELQIAYFEES